MHTAHICDGFEVPYILPQPGIQAQGQMSPHHCRQHIWADTGMGHCRSCHKDGDLDYGTGFEMSVFIKLLKNPWYS